MDLVRLPTGKLPATALFFFCFFFFSAKGEVLGPLCDERYRAPRVEADVVIARIMGRV